MKARRSWSFWIYLMTNALIFAALFATFTVLSGSYAGGPSPRRSSDAWWRSSTALLLLSSITFGFAVLEMNNNQVDGTRKEWLIVTAALGAAFVGVEDLQFSRLIADGAGPQRSAFLSAFPRCGQHPRSACHNRHHLDRDDAVPDQAARS